MEQISFEQRLQLLELAMKIEPEMGQQYCNIDQLITNYTKLVEAVKK